MMKRETWDRTAEGYNVFAYFYPEWDGDEGIWVEFAGGSREIFDGPVAADYMLVELPDGREIYTEYVLRLDSEEAREYGVDPENPDVDSFDVDKFDKVAYAFLKTETIRKAYEEGVAVEVLKFPE